MGVAVGFTGDVLTICHRSANIRVKDVKSETRKKPAFSCACELGRDISPRTGDRCGRCDTRYGDKRSNGF